jgi:hypothetical protein
VFSMARLVLRKTEGEAYPPFKRLRFLVVTTSLSIAAEKSGRRQAERYLHTLRMSDRKEHSLFEKKQIHVLWFPKRFGEKPINIGNRKIRLRHAQITLSKTLLHLLG